VTERPVPPGTEVSDRDQRLFIAWEGMSRDVIDVKRAYIRVAGDMAAGVLLSQCVYWFLPARDGSSKLTIERDGKWWLAKKREDWWEECCLRGKQFDRCVVTLEELDLIWTAVYKFQGSPAKHISLNWSQLIHRLADDAAGSSQGGKSIFLNREYGNSSTGNKDVPQQGTSSNNKDYSIEHRIEGSVTPVMQAPVERKYDFTVEPSEGIPGGLQPLQYARGVLEQVSVPSSVRLLDQCGQAIGFLAKAEKVELHEATRLMIGRALSAQGRGETVNGFWFMDKRWEQDGVANQRSQNRVAAATDEFRKKLHANGSAS